MVPRGSDHIIGQGVCTLSLSLYLEFDYFHIVILYLFCDENKVRMVTGDNINTAMAIGKECGIYDPDYGVALEGPVFRAMSPAQVRR